MSRQPTVGGDSGTWGTVLNDYLSVSINADGTLKDVQAINFVSEYGALTGAGNEATNLTAWNNLVSQLNANTTRSGLRTVWFKKGAYYLNSTVLMDTVQHATFIFEGGAFFNESIGSSQGCYWVWSGAAGKYMFMLDTVGGTNQNSLRWIGSWNMGSSNVQQGYGIWINNQNNWGGLAAAFGFGRDGSNCLQRGVVTSSVADNAHGVASVFSNNIPEGAIYAEGGGFNVPSGNISHDDNQIGIVIAGNAQRTVSDMVNTNASTTITSATAGFNTWDRGRPIQGTGIPTHAYIVSVTNAMTAVMSAGATSGGSVRSLTIGSLVPGSEMKLAQNLKIDGGANGAGGAIGVLCYGGFSQFDGVSFEGYNTAARTTSADAHITNGSTTVTSATASFTSADAPVGLLPGRTIAGPGIPNGTRIASVTNSTTAVMDTTATATTTTGTITISNYAIGIEIRRVENNTYSCRLNQIENCQFSGHDGTMVPWRVSDPGTFGSAFNNAIHGTTYNFTMNMDNTTTSDPIVVPNGYGMLCMVQDGARLDMAGLGPIITGGGGGSPTGAAGGSLSGTYPNPGLAANSVGSTQIASSAVTTAKIASNAVTSGLLATAVMQGKRIEAGRVTGLNISAFGTVTGTVTYGSSFGSAPALVIFPDANGDVVWDRNVHVDGAGAGSFPWSISTGSSGVSNVLFSWIAIGG